MSEVLPPDTPPRRPASPFVIRAAEVEAHMDAAAIRADAALHARQVAGLAQAEREAAVRAGHEDGLRSGAAQAAGLAAGAAAAVEAFWDQREAELRDLAIAVAHRLLASLPPHEVLARLATEAVREHRSDVRLTLRVGGADAGPLRAALADADPHGRVAVEADPGAAPGSCVLVHPRGRTRVGLLDQFRALMEAGG